MLPQEALQVTFNAFTCIFTGIAALAVLAAFAQVREARKSVKVDFLMKTVDMWRDEEIYRAVEYIHRLRREWKRVPLTEWDSMAKQWVVEHVNKSYDCDDADERRLAKEWMQYHTVAQFLSKLGLVSRAGYLKHGNAFGAMPEIGRLLVVVIPIELAIQAYWLEHEAGKLADWDEPYAKPELDDLWEDWQRWAKEQKQNKPLSKPHLEP